MSNSVESLILSHFLRLRFFFIHRFIHIIHIFHRPVPEKNPRIFLRAAYKKAGLYTPPDHNGNGEIFHGETLSGTCFRTSFYVILYVRLSKSIQPQRVRALRL